MLILRILPTVLLALLVGTAAQAALPPIENDAMATLSAGYDSTATSITLTTGGGAKFPTPSTAYNVVWWNCTDYTAPHLDPDRERVRVTGKTTDTLTIVRAQEGTSAVNHDTSGKTYCLAQTFSKAYWDALAAEIGGSTGLINDLVDASAYAGGFSEAVTDVGTAVKTIRLSNDQPISANVTLHANTVVECTGSGKLSIATGATVTAVRPEQFRCARHRQIFALAGTGKIVFSLAGTVYPAWWGALGDGVADDGPEIQAAHDSLPAAGGKIDFGGGGTFKSNNEILLSKSDVVVQLGPATLNIANIAGAGTSNVHTTDAVLAGFKVTGANVKVAGGRITGVPTVASMQTIGVLIAGATNARVGGLQISGLFACVWIGGDAVNPLLQNVDCGSNSYGVELGYWPTTSSLPQVNRPTLLNVRAHNSTTGDGVHCASFTYDLQMVGGQYDQNAGHGLNLYPGCERGMVISGVFNHNAKSGIYGAYGPLTGTASGKLGIAKRITLANNFIAANSEWGMIVYLPDYSLFSSVGGVEEWTITGNISQGNGYACYFLDLVRSSFTGNLARGCTEDGIVLASVQDVQIAGNQSWDHGTGGNNRPAYLFQTAPTTGGSPPDNTRVTFVGNHGGDTRSGGSRTVNYAANLANITNSTVSANVMQNAATTDWQNTTGHAGLVFAQNIGTGTIGTAYAFRFSGAATYDPPSLGDWERATTTVTVTGAAVGDRVTCGHSTITAAMQVTGVVSAADTATVVILNHSGGTVDAASGTLTCEAWR